MREKTCMRELESKIVLESMRELESKRVLEKVKGLETSMGELL